MLLLLPPLPLLEHLQESEREIVKDEIFSRHEFLIKFREA
jgi:hypothetical protein